MFSDQDREYLNAACKLAEAARKPPKKLGEAIEPYWAAVLASPAGMQASAVFQPGDPEDAVKKLPPPTAADTTLYLTLEPKAGFDRMPPTTESIRRLGVQRVVIGTLDPAQRLRGEGVSTLERMGIEVVQSNGEEARLSQDLLADYSKWLQKGFAVLRARVELNEIPNEEILDLKFNDKIPIQMPVDAVLCRAGVRPKNKDAWRVVLDFEGWERAAPQAILYQPEEVTQAPGARRLPMQNGAVNLGALLRDLASLGILSVELCQDPELFRQALSTGLLDSVFASFADTHMLARIGHVRLIQGDETVDLRLDGARLMDGQKGCLEARVTLC